MISVSKIKGDYPEIKPGFTKTPRQPQESLHTFVRRLDAACLRGDFLQALGRAERLELLQFLFDSHYDGYAFVRGYFNFEQMKKFLKKPTWVP